MGNTSSTSRDVVRWAVLPLAVTTAVVIAGCTFGSASPASTDAAPAVHEPVAGSGAACVPDPEAVAVSEDAQSTEPVDAELADQYDEAAATVYERVQEVVPGVVVGVRSPAGTWTSG